MAQSLLLENGSKVQLENQSGDLLLEDQTILPAPVLTGTAGDGFAFLSWGQVAGGSGLFNVYRSPIILGQPLVIDNSSPLVEFEDDSVTNGVTYQYWVFAVDDAGNEGAKSNIVTLTPEQGGSFVAGRRSDNESTWALMAEK